ncbi:MAG: prepilin-type N-terminal cleavage/methylation domain-containing protein [Desulfobacteraceae bacterium]
MKDKSQKTKGFTLIELVVVITIMGVVLSFVLPQFHSFRLFSGSGTSVGKIAATVTALKQRAVAESRNYTLHMDPGMGRIWITHEFMKQEDRERAENSAMALENGISIVDVEFPGNPGRGDSAEIFFSREGYSDMAMIHLEDTENEITIIIEPFLAEVEIEKRYVSFDGCS